MRLAKLHIRFALPIFVVGAVVLALPSAASAAEFSLTIETASGTGYGEVNCKVNGEEAQPCASEYESGINLVLVPAPEEGSKFAGFKSGTGSAAGCTGTSTCSFKLTANSSVDAPFDLILKKLVVNVTGEGKGEVECEGELFSGIPCDGEYPVGSEITLTPTAEFGSEFAGFKNGTGSAVGCVGTDPCTFQLKANSSVNALFERTRYMLTAKKVGTGSGAITSSPAGINCGSDCTEEYTEDTEVTVTATASASSKFISWADCPAEPEPGKCKVTMDAAKSVEAEFATTTPGEFNLKVNKAGTGSGSVTCNGGACAASYPTGTKITLVAFPSSGSSFGGWSGGNCSGTGSCVVTITANTTLTATFTANSAAPTPKPPPAKAGTAKVGATAKVKAGKAQLKLTCSGGTCKGTLKLTAKIKQGKTTKNLTIGKASFSLASGASSTIKVKLSVAAKQAMKGGKTLKARVGGSGVASSTVKLKS